MDTELIACAGLFLLLEEEEERARKRPRKPKTWWVRPLFLEGSGFYLSLRDNLRAQDPQLFKNFLRMTVEDYDYLLDKVTPYIAKQNTVMREAISAGERLAITLRYLATGDSYSSLMFLFKRSKSSICKIVEECFEALYTCLKDEFLKVPNTPEEWEAIAGRFWEKLNFPNCFGAIDGKHVDIIQPANSGSQYFNYKSRVR